MPLSVQPEIPGPERAARRVALTGLALRWSGLALFLPLVDLRSAEAPLAVLFSLAAGYGLAGAALLLPLARLSDAVGRRAVLAATTATYGLGALLAAWGSLRGEAWAAAGGRLAMGLGAAGAGAALGWLEDWVDAERFGPALGFAGFAGAAATGLGPAAGVLLGLLPSAFAPLALGAAALPALVLLARTREVRKTCSGALEPEPRSQTLFNLGTVLRTPQLAGPLAALLSTFAAATMAFGLVPGAVAELGTGLTAVSVLGATALASGGLALGSRLVNRRRGGLALALSAGAVWAGGTLLASRALGHAATPALVVVVALALALLLAGAASATSATAALLLERAPETWRGTAMLVHFAAALAGSGLGGAAAVLARSSSFHLAPIPLAALAVGAAAGALLPRPRPITPRTPAASV